MSTFGNLATFSSIDLRKWTPFAFGPSDFETNYGVQIVGTDEGFVGVTTAKDKSLISTKLENGWTAPKKLPALYKALGRVSVTVIEDRYYVAYRGTNDGVYLVYTTDFEKWTDLGRVGSKYAKSTVAPAVTVIETYDKDENFEAEKLLVTGVGEDKYIYYTIVDKDGKRDISWTKIEGTGTQSALELVPFYGSARLFHTAYNNGAFFYQDYDSVDKKWSTLTKVVAEGISSGISAHFSSTGFFAAYKGAEAAVYVKTQGSGGSWSDATKLPFAQMLYQLGTCHHGVRGGLLSVPIDIEDEETRYRIPTQMNKKSMYVSEKEVEQWDCKWQEKESSKGMFSRFFCC